ncbi:DUF928 domain-containing protein [Trichocoleus sp. FACHB-262]|uniref:DUF928 domain-containing protein n=1 Tax=Trichocoleus sp. FACHB-262 TaxID=2692869 RepID=UPI001688E35A|nr:DUF928 domain-containing protein [Trichocoleus sp. FACHB-262]MBD2120540.1 DUF928 domain-containing protein [Trichocoleus sp. FACHB-262]
MRLLKEMKVGALAVLLGSIAAIELMPIATALPTQGTLMARSRRLNFRVGVRPSWPSSYRGGRVGGFSRSSASCGTQMPAALVPPPQAQEKVATNKMTVDKTASERPTFFVYLPSLDSQTAQFTLQNEARTKQLHNVTFKLTGKPGVVGISLPNSAPALQVGQKYFWQVAVGCDPDDPASVMVISSWVERVKLPTITANNRLAVLAERGIWQDVVTQIALQRYQNPGDRAAVEDWSALMEDAGLRQYKQAAIVQIVKN